MDEKLHDVYTNCTSFVCSIQLKKQKQKKLNENA